ncbi:protein JINGUBANG [Phragmites australis]|uniref:protein JINGUBANG n=1 Tax=Phragmites australis TaxID=29695 RepID=UPI002D7935C0|nr:protein JINGUBANG [Phragmites australis]
MLSQSVSLSSQPSLPSLPSLGTRDTNVSPSLHQCVASLRGHSSYVSALAVDGDSLYRASSDGRIMVWPLDDASSRQEQQDDDSRSGTVIASSNSSVKCLLAAGNGLLLSSHQDGKIRAWRVGSRKDGTRRLVLRAVLPIVVDRLRTCLLPWSYVEVRRHRRRTWVHHVDAVTALAVSPDGALLYSASWDRSLKVWRLPDFRCVESIAPAHDDAINALAVSPDGNVYTGSADKKIKAWRRHAEQKNKHVLVQTMERHRSAVNALALGVEGKVLYSGACDRSVVVWERAEGGAGRMEATGTLRGHAMAILCLAAAWEVVCSGSADRTVRVWRREAGNTGYTCLAVLEGHGAAVKSLALVCGRDGGWEEGSSGGGGDGGGSDLVCSGALDGEVKIWSVLVPCLLQR